MKPSKSLLSIAVAAGSLMFAVAPVHAQSDNAQSANTATPPMANSGTSGSMHKHHRSSHHMKHGGMGAGTNGSTAEPGTPSSHHGAADGPQGTANGNGS